MPREKTKKEPNKPKAEKIRLHCCTCGIQFKNVEKETYGSHSPIWSHYGRLLVCKECLDDDYNKLLIRFANNVKKTTYYFNMRYDIPFIEKLFESSAQYIEKHPSSKLYVRYLTTYNSFYEHNKYASCFLDGQDSLIYNENKEDSSNYKRRKTRMTDADKQNKKDVLNILGYDPFESEPEQDKKYLYNKLIDFLDDSTLEDNFKIPIVIEITKGFSQVERLNELINQIYESKDAIESGKEIKELITTRTNALGSILSLAKDNGISANHNLSKSKGAGTLSGILKDLQSKKFDEAEVNLFDIETCDGMRQVADISHRSIFSQLKWDENTYTEMIQEQRKMIKETTEENIRIKEELRLLKIKQKEEA